MSVKFMKDVVYCKGGVALLLAALLSSLACRAEAQQKQHLASGIDKTGVIWAKKARQGCTAKIWLSNQMEMGRQAWEPLGLPPDPCTSGGLGLEFPVGSCVEHLFGAGPWIGGKVDGVRRVSEGYNGDAGDSEFYPERQDSSRDRIWRTSTNETTFDLNFDPPRLLNRPVNRRFIDDDGDGKIDEDDLDGFDNDSDWVAATDDIGADGLPDSLEVSCDGKTYDPVTNSDPAYDNYDPRKFDYCRTIELAQHPRKNDPDWYTQNNGRPDHGEPNVDEDYGAVSESDMYLSSTDTFTSYPPPHNHISMGMKIVQKSYAWCGSYTEGILPMDYYFINVGKKIITDVYVGFFVDCDLGPVNVDFYWTHDFAGYYPDLHTSYIHNAVDRGSTPLGLTVLGTPRRLDSLRFVFQWMDFTTNMGPGPTDSLYWSWMSCEYFGYQNCVMVNQSPGNPSDTRYLLAFGPFNPMAPGDTLKISVAFVLGYGLESGPGNLRENVHVALNMYKRNYVLPSYAASPPLRITEDQNKVYLDWHFRAGDPGMDPMETWDDSCKFCESLPDTSWRRIDPPPGHTRGGRSLGGYRLWRSDAINANRNNYTLLADFNAFDTPRGYHSGLHFSYIDSMVRTGSEHWYAVTAYSLPEMVTIALPDTAGNVSYDTLWNEPYETSIYQNAQKVRLNFRKSTNHNEVTVVPNPYRGDNYYTDGTGFEGAERDWTPAKRQIWFIHLPEKATIRIFTIAGEVITTIEHDDGFRKSKGLPTGQEEWHLFTEAGRPLASGIYVFTIESDFGTQIGKFVVIM